MVEDYRQKEKKHNTLPLSALLPNCSALLDKSTYIAQCCQAGAQIYKSQEVLILQHNGNHRPQPSVTRMAIVHDGCAAETQALLKTPPTTLLGSCTTNAQEERHLTKV
jgi:hypothetical protein